MFLYMAMTVIREKESFKAIQLRLLAFLTLKSWTCQLVENLLKIETPLNVIFV